MLCEWYVFSVFVLVLNPFKFLKVFLHKTGAILPECSFVIIDGCSIKTFCLLPSIITRILGLFRF